MADSKELYLRNPKEELDDMSATLHSKEFERLIVFARAEFAQRNPTKEQTIGANNFISILLDLPEQSEKEPEWVESGLHHDLSIPERTEQTKEK